MIIYYEMSDNKDDVITKPKCRGRPKVIKTEEEIQEQKRKQKERHNEYHRNYYKQRSLIDPEYKERYRQQLNERTKRYYHRTKDKNKEEKEELIQKAKLYDELVAKLN